MLGSLFIRDPNYVYMKKLLFVLFFIVTRTLPAQSVGYEMRTNHKDYLFVNYEHFELRHKTDLSENRVTYRQSVDLKKDKVIFSVPLHYKIENHILTLEPKLSYKYKNYALWTEYEFWYHHHYNAVIAVDVTKNNIQYRAGWDTSNTFRFRVLVKLNN